MIPRIKYLLLLGTCLLGTLCAEESISHLGQSFSLAQRSTRAGVETDEYLLSGETLAAWSQLVSVQRVSLPRRISSEELLSFIKLKQQKAGEGAVTVLLQGKNACVFSTRFVETAGCEEQVMVALALSNPKDPSGLFVLHYAYKPKRLEDSLAQEQLRGWKEKFTQQALQLNRSDDSSLSSRVP
jgi:hypothetical protein